MKRLFTYMRRYWLPYTFGIACTFLTATLTISSRFFARRDQRAASAHRDLVAHYAELMIAFAVVLGTVAMDFALRHLQHRPRHRIRNPQRSVRSTDQSRRRFLSATSDRRSDVADGQRHDRGAHDGRHGRADADQHAVYLVYALIFMTYSIAQLTVVAIIPDSVPVRGSADLPAP